MKNTIEKWTAALKTKEGQRKLVIALVGVAAAIAGLVYYRKKNGKKRY